MKDLLVFDTGIITLLSDGKMGYLKRIGYNTT